MKNHNLIWSQFRLPLEADPHESAVTTKQILIMDGFFSKRFLKLSRIKLLQLKTVYKEINMDGFSKPSINIQTV
jgi:hypothetical protein